MADKKMRPWVFGVLLILLGSCVTILNVKFPSVVEELYAHGKIEVLKKASFCNAQESRPLDYYAGRIEDLWVGPLTSVVTGGLFLLFCLWFLQGAGAFPFAAATFLYLLLSRSQVLFHPPCGDALFGVLSEPLWLVRHHLDWVGLLQQKTYVLGGPLQYPGSIYPELIALLLYFSPSPQIFLLINHLIVFAAGALLVAIIREALREYCDSGRATLGAVLLLALPLFQCHVELLNMEIVCACFVATSLLMVLRKNFFMASAMAVFATMVKVSGAITMPMLLGTCLVSFFNEPDKKKFARDLLWVLGACSIAYYLLTLRLSTVTQPSLFHWGTSKIASDLLPQPVLWICLFLSIFYLGWVVFGRLIKKTGGKSFSADLPGHFKSLPLFLILAAWLASLSHAPAMIPRYAVLVMPFVLLFLVYLLSEFVKKERVFTGLLVLTILFTLACSHGLLYMNQKPVGGVSPHEKSLEYRNVLKVYRRAAEEVEKNYSGYTIGADIVMAQSLVFGEAGYVHTPLKDVFVYGSGATHEEIRPYPGLQSISPRTVWMADTTGDPYYLTNFPIGPADTILEEIWAGDKRITLFAGGFSVLDWAMRGAERLGYSTRAQRLGAQRPLPPRQP